MSVPKITHQDHGRAVLTLIEYKQLDYSTAEKIDDIVASSMEFLKSLFDPWRALQSLVASTEDVPFESSSPETIAQIVEKHFAEVEEKDHINEKLSYISDKVQKYAEKLNLGKVDLYFSLEENQLASASKIFNTQSIWITRYLVFCSFETIDFLVAHELMHIQNNDSMKQLRRIFSQLILCCIFIGTLPLIYSIPLIMLTNGVASLFFNALSRRYEKEADKGALDLLQTNTGMIDFCTTLLGPYLAIKYPSMLDPKKFGVENTTKSDQSQITPIGNSRYDFTHPPLTERLKMALAFVPKTQISQSTETG